MFIYKNYDILEIETKNESLKDKYNIVEVTGGKYESIRNSWWKETIWNHSY